MKRKVIRFNKKRWLVKNIKHTRRGFDVVAYFDNSIITRLRKRQGRYSKKARREIKFISLSFVRKYNIKNIHLTDKLFLEIIGCGQLRAVIVKGNRDLINTEKKKIRDKVISAQQISQEDIQGYYNFLENLFRISIRAKLPQENIYPIALQSLTEYSFCKEFNVSIRNRVLDYAKNISISSLAYGKFIDSLVNDSVIRYLLDIINFREIPREYLQCAGDFIIKVNNFIILKYWPKDLFRKDLILLMSGLEHSVRAPDNPGKKVEKLLRPEDDFADSEMQNLVFYGTEIDGECYPVTVLSGEPIELVDKRLKYYYAAVATLINLKPAYMGHLTKDPRRFLLGRSIVINFKKNNYITIDLIPHHEYGITMQKK
jgi:hypothetical protein